MKARVGFSPDEVDAIVYAHMTPEELMFEDKPRKEIVYESPDEMLGDDIPTYLQLLDSWL